jgi:hypothetical protein
VKPREVRAMRVRQEQERAARGKALEEFLHSGADTTKVQRELIPAERDLREALREYRRSARVWAGARGVKRMRLLDETMIALARIVYLERVLALDPLERAGLTPAQLVALSRIHPDDLRARLARFQGESAVQR